MKIAVVHNLPAGGQKRALFEQVKRLSRKHRLDLYTLSTADESYLPLKAFVKKQRIFAYNNPPKFPQSVAAIYFSLPQTYKQMASEIDVGGYDRVFVSPCFLTQAPFILRYLKTPSLYYCPEPKREFYEKIPHFTNRWTYLATLPFRLPLKKIDRENARRATRILTNSKYSQKKIEEVYGVKSMVNYLGVDTKVFCPIKIAKENIVLSVGNLSLHKGHDFLIRSLSLIPKNVRPKLVIVGQKGVDKDYFLKQARALNVVLEIYENISDENLVKWYNRAKVMGFAPLAEPFGLSFLEALSCGTPVVAVSEGGVGEIITGRKIGELVPRDARQFARKIREVIGRTELSDWTRRQELYEWVEKNWNWEKSVVKLENYLCR